jgi:hypothetical protein
MPKEANKKPVAGSKKTKKNYKNIIRITIAILFVVIVGSAYFLLSSDFSGVTLTVQTDGPARIGESFDIMVTLENNSDEEVSDTTVALSLPVGVSFADGRGDLRRTKEVKTIPAGGFEREVFKVIITEFSDTKTFEAEAEYLPASLGREIKTSKSLSVEVQKWLTLGIEAPDKIVSGEEFEWIFSYENDTDKDQVIDLELEFPEELMGDMPSERFKISAGEHKQTVFTAFIVMEEGEIFSIKAIARGDIGDKEYILGNAETEITIASSPLSIDISSSKEEGEPLLPGEEPSYTISFRNNSDVAMKDIRLEADIMSDMLDESVSKNMNWSIVNMPELGEINPGKSAVVTFKVKIADTYPIKKLNDRDFTLKITARIESPTVPYAIKAIKTVNMASLEQKIAGKADVVVEAFYRDAVSGVVNDGVFPPTVGQITEYSVHWKLVNYSTDMSEVEISAEIPPGVEFVKQVKVDAGEFSSDESNRIIWKIPKILATTGILSKPVTAIFQVKAVPEARHVGSYMPLLGPTNITAKDDFTESAFSAFKEFITTELPSDKTVSPADGIVR